MPHVYVSGQLDFWEERKMRQSAMFMTVALALCCVGILAHSAEGVNLQLACEPPELCWGDELSVLASCENTGEAIAVDLYLAVTLPSGDVFYFPDGSLNAPFMSSVMIPESASFSSIEVFSNEVPHGLVAGEYYWALIATSSGTGDILAEASATMRLGYDCWEGFSALNAVRSLLLKDDYLFIGTKLGGVAKYDLASGQHVRYGMSEGLASNEGHNFCLDGAGRVWAGTGFYIFMGGNYYEFWGGISRFDGSDWTSFYPSDHRSDCFTNRCGNRIDAIAYSPIDDAVYAVSRDGDFHRVMGDMSYGVSIPGDETASWICSHPDGGVCVLTNGGLYELHEGSWKKLADGGYPPIFVSSDGTIWCSSEYYGLYRLGEDGSWRMEQELEDRHIVEIVESYGRVWVLTYHRLYIWDGLAWSHEDLPISFHGEALAVSETGTVYIGSDEGILTYSAGLWGSIPLNSPYYNPLTMYLYEGVSDAAFRGSDSFIVRWPYISSFDGSSWSALPPRGSPQAPGDESLFVDSAGTLWEYGLNWWGLELAALRDNQWEVLLIDQWPGGDPFLAQDASGALWLYGSDRNHTNEPVYVYEEARGLTRFDNIMAAVEKRYDILCVSEPKTDVWLLDVQREIVWVTLVQPEAFYDFRVVPASYDGQTWVIYEGPLPGGGLIRAFRDHDNRSPLDMDDEGNIWTLTDLGLCRLNRSEVWYESSGRIDDLAPPLHVDDHGNVWIAAEIHPVFGHLKHQGLARYNIADGTWQDYTEREVPICDWIHNIRSAPNGDVWFCTWDGVTRYSQGPK